MLTSSEVKETDSLVTMQVCLQESWSGIHPKLFYETRIEIGEALANLFKNSINSGELPRDLKDAVVILLFKMDAEAHLLTTDQ